MDITSFLGGTFLTHLDLPGQSAVWTIAAVSQQTVGTDQKICIQFQQHQKALGLNKTNLRAVATAYGTNSQSWIGKALELYRDQTFFQGRQTPCIRLRVPQQQQTAAAPLQPQPAWQPQQPVQQQPAAPPQPAADPQAGAVSSPGAPPWGSQP